MRPCILLLTFICVISLRGADSSAKKAGDWLLVNGVLVLQISTDGMMTLRNTGVKGKLTVAPDGGFTWEVTGEPPTKGMFQKERLLLKNVQEGAPKWLEFLEFKRADKDTANEVLEIALRQQTTALAAFAKVRENSVKTSVLNNLRQLAAAADQHFLEYGTTKAAFDQLVGPDKYIKKLEPVDGEDYSKLDLNQDNSEFKVTTASGVTVTYSR